MGTTKSKAKTKTRRGRPPKPDSLDETLKIRVSAEQRQLIERAAERVTAARGAVNVSGWIRATLLERAREVLRENEG